MKPANASAMRSSSDPVRVHWRIRTPDELTLSLRLSRSRISWGLSDSASDPGVKRSGNSALGALRVVPHSVAVTGSVKCGKEHSGQRDFVKLVQRRLSRVGGSRNVFEKGNL